MASTFILFDTRSGRILGVHHGAANAEVARRGLRNLNKIQGADVDDDRVGVLELPSSAFEQGQHYKVDVERKALINVASKRGVAFAFGPAQKS